MDFPANVIEIVTKAITKSPEDPMKAAKLALASIKKLPEFKELVDTMLMQAVQSLVDNRRQYINRCIRHESTNPEPEKAAGYDGPAKVVTGLSASASKAYTSVFLYNIGGKVIGMLFGKDLPDIAENERKAGDGHYFNANLMEALRPLVPKDKTVQQSVSEAKLRKLFQALRKKQLTAA